MVCIAKTATGVQCLEKASLSSCSCVYHCRFLFCVRHNQSKNLDYKTTRVGNTSTSSYSVISRSEQLFIFFGVTNVREEICQVSVLVRTIFPCCQPKHIRGYPLNK